MTAIIKTTINDTELKAFIERIEHLAEDKKEITDHIADVYLEAKSKGFVPQVMKHIVRRRKMEKDALADEQALLEVYTDAVGVGESNG